MKESLPDTRGGAGERRYGGLSAAERAAQRRERLLAAGERLFGSRGYAATTIEALYSEAALAPRYFYESFAGKEELFLAVYGRLADRVRDDVAAAVAAAPPEPVAITRAGMSAALQAYEDPRVARIVLFEVSGAGQAIEAQRRAEVEAFSEVVSGALAAATDLTPRESAVTAMALIGAALEVVAHHVAEPRRVTADEATETMVRLVASLAESGPS